MLALRFGVEAADYPSMLLGLRDETVGGLLFAPGDGAPPTSGAYEPVGGDFFERFASLPRRVAAETMGRVRLSLAGERPKATPKVSL